MRILIYDKDRLFRGQVGAPKSLVTTPRAFPLIGTAVMTVPLSSPQVANLTAPGARMVFQEDGEHVLSGPIDQILTDSEDDSLTVTVVDDSWILTGILGWPVPTSPITSQSGAEYRSYTGPAETVIKNVVRENGVNRLRIPGLTVAADLGRGTTIAGGTTYRMHPIQDRVYPGLEIAGIGLQVRQVGANLVFDVYVPRRYPVTLSKEAGTLKRVTHSRKRPTASRAVIGGPGEGKARRFRALTDTARESVWGFVGETYKDARDIQQEEGVTTWTAVDSQLDGRGREALQEAREVDGLSVTLAQSSIFTYGQAGFLVGDIVPVDVRGALITDTVKEARLEWVTPNYTRVAPVIGEQTDAETRRAKTLAALKESQRKEERA